VGSFVISLDSAGLIEDSPTVVNLTVLLIPMFIELERDIRVLLSFNLNEVNSASELLICLGIASGYRLHIVVSL